MTRARPAQRTRTGCVVPIAVGWWAGGDRDRAADGPAGGDLAADRPPAGRCARQRPTLPEHRPSAILINRLWPLFALHAPRGSGFAFLAPQIPGIASRLRDHLGARLAPAGRGGRCDRGARRCLLLRPAHSPLKPMSLAAHPRLQAATRPEQRQRRRHLRWARGRPRTSCSSRWARPTGLRIADEQFAESLRGPARASRSHRAQAPAQVRTLMLTDLLWARAAAGRGRAASRLELPASRDLLEYHRGAALAASRVRSASTRLERATGPAATASGSARSSGGVWQQAPLLLPLSEQAMDEAPPSPGRPLARSCSRSRSRPRARRRRCATSPRSPTGPTLEEGPRPGTGGLGRLRGTPGREDPGELVIAGVEQSELDGPPASCVPDEAGVRVVGSSPRRSTGRSCAALASSSARRGGRTTGRPSSRRSPTAACS